jgi:hypothetical protein
VTYTITTPAVFLAKIEPFNQLSAKTQARIAKIGQYYRYHVGQPISVPDQLLAQVSIIAEGTVRLLGYPDQNSSPVTLKRLEIGSVIGIISTIRGIPCESAIASTEVVCLNIPIESFMQIIEQEPILKQYFYDQPSLIEIFEILRLELEKHPNPDQLLQLLAVDSLKDLALKAFDTAVVYPNTQTIPPDRTNWDWFVGSQLPNSLYTIGDRLEIDSNRHRQKLRPIGISPDILQVPPQLDAGLIVDIDGATIVPDSFNLNIGPPQNIPYAPDLPLARVAPKPDRGRYPLVRGKGQIDGTVACFEMLANQFKIPFRRDSVRKVVAHHFDQTGGVSLQFCGAVADFLGLQGQLATIPIADLQRIQVPALIKWQDGLGVIYAVTNNSITIALPDSGLIKRSPQELLLNQGSAQDDPVPNPSIPILLIQATRSTPEKKFGISWFWPSLVHPFLFNYLG